ncbi:MAG: DUF167 domain-containing protein [Bacteriovoracaceae bacterium]|nr:DUF167 domain-containing protein [Bacteriovoracaceae bacterium]
MVLTTHPLIDQFKAAGINIHQYTTTDNYLDLAICIRAKPGSKLQKMLIGQGGEIIISTTKRAVEGEANKAIKKILSDTLGVSGSNISLDKGHNSKHKRYLIRFIFTKHKQVEYYIKKVANLTK